jgi:integrase/recombinase XerD
MSESAIEDDVEDELIQRRLKRLHSNIGDGEKEIAESSYDRYEKDLIWFDGYLQESGLNSEEASSLDVDDALATLSDKYNGTTPGRRWRTINNFYRMMVKLEVIDQNPCENVDLDDHAISNSTKQSEFIDDDSNENLYAPSDEEVDQMIQHAPSERHRVRNQLLIVLMYHTGCRCNEIRQIKIDDIEREDQEIRLRGSTTKTGKARTVRYGDSAVGLLREWLDDGYRSRLKYSHSPYLFISIRSEKMSKSRVNEIVRNAARNAGINEVLYQDASGNDRWKITSHTLRHACGTYMVENGVDIYKVSKYLGHSSIEITEKIYVHDDGSIGVDEAHELGPQ